MQFCNIGDKIAVGVDFIVSEAFSLPQVAEPAQLSDNRFVLFMDFFFEQGGLHVIAIWL